MIKLFKRKTELEKLNSQYKKLLAQVHQLSSVDRAASDAKFEEANALLTKIEALENEAKTKHLNK